MKKILSTILVALLILPLAGSETLAKPKSRSLPKKQVRRAPAPKTTANFARVAERQSTAEVDKEIRGALALAKEGKFEEASRQLFAMSRSPRFAARRMEIRYFLGIALFEMKLYQVAAFQFIAVIRDGNTRFVRQALEKLSIAADHLNDDTMLNYAVSKIKLNDFPKSQHDMLRFRIGEIQLKSKLFPQAVNMLSDVSQGSEWFAKAKYLEGLANTERGNYNGALRNFSDLVQSQSHLPVNHNNRVTGIMGMARVYYQQQKWEQAIDLYRQVPRDSELWHDVLFEMSWAQMRAAQFRNVLSNFHSLHSPYYEDFYIPESLLLRSIVYLYICQYDEMEKTLDLFESIYKPVLSSLTNFLRAYNKSITYYDEVAVQQDNFENLKKNRDDRRKFKIPFLVARQIMQEGDYSRLRNYIVGIKGEMQTLDKISDEWRRSELGQYASKLLRGRLNNARKVAGKHVRDHIVAVRNELAGLFEQHGFARYEMLNGRKEQLKKKIAGKTLDKKQLDDDAERTYYIQNGYEYWPFSGEYWLDEIGNYHYLGTQSCE